MQVLVLNSDYSYLNICDWRRAIILITKGKVEVVEYTDKVIQNYSGTYKYKVPSVVKLNNFVQNIYKSKVKFTKQNVFVRDNYTCSYCGTKEGKMTIDHIVPVSKGGKTDWSNCCCSCTKCNFRKADKSVYESGLKLRITPQIPSIAQFLNCKKTHINFELKMQEVV